MAVSLVGAVGSTRATTAPITGAYGQPPTAGNLLVAVVTGTGSTAATPTVTCSTTGWFHLYPAVFAGPAGNNGTGTSHALVDVWGKAATGGDTAPAFTAGVSGTITTAVTIFELSGANTVSPMNMGLGTYESGSTAATLSSMDPEAWQPLTSGDFGISAFVQERATTTVTWTETGTGWTSAYSDGTTNSTGHRQVNYQAGPSATAYLADSGHFSTDTTAYGAGVVFTIVPPGVNEDPSELADYYFETDETPVSITYGAFSPPAGSMAVALVSVGYDTLSTSDDPSVTLSDSGSHTWTAGPAVFDNSAEWAGIYTCYFAAAPGSITVTAANSDSAHGAAGMMLDVRVVTGMASSQAGAATATAFSASNVTAISGSIDTTTAGSLVFMASSLGAGISTWTQGTSTVTESAYEDTTDGATYFAGRAANLTTTRGSLTLGYTSATAAPYAWAALEILPAGTLALSRPVIALQAVNRASTY